MNQIRNPDNLSSIAPVKADRINIQKVNLQDPGGYLLVGLTILGIVLFMLVMEKGLISLHLSPLKFGSAVAFFGLAIFIGIKAYDSLANDIKFKETYESRREVIREKLMLIKDLQVEYLSSNKVYAGSWDTLVDFAKNDSVQIIRYLVDKNDTAAVNTALRNGKPLKDTAYVPVDVKVFGEGHSVNLDSIAYVPFTKKQFGLKAKSAKNANDRDMFFLEVKTKNKTYVDMLDIYPENFDEESITKIGSLTEPTTDGNW